jgi:hypothetical protein
MKSWRWGFLLFELFLLALILVLPQVDLPDFAFHRGTAPIIASTQSQPTRQFGHREEDRSRLVSHASPRPLFLLLCTLLC